MGHGTALSTCAQLAHNNQLATQKQFNFFMLRFLNFEFLYRNYIFDPESLDFLLIERIYKI